MDHTTELQQAVYNVLLTQIQFGTYQFKENLPAMDVASKQFLVSLDTVRAAYRRLKQEGYISLSKNVGAIVQVKYQEPQTIAHIRSYFAPRRSALIDLSESMVPLFGGAQRIGLKHAHPEILDDMEQLAATDAPAPTAMLHHLKQQYAPLGNGLLMRLVWQIYMFYQAPFFSLPAEMRRLQGSTEYVPQVVRYCRRQDWAALHDITSRFQEALSSALCCFLREDIPAQSSGEEIAFCWSSYRKPSQLRYSLAMELLIEINNGLYPAGTLLPTLEQLAKIKNVSISTVRRALALLSSIGAIHATPKIGTRIVPFDQVSQNCDFSLPTLQQRLLDTIQGLQFLALSCKDVSRVTLASLTPSEMQQWKKRLCEISQQQRYDVTSYSIIKLITKFSPYQTIRQVYTELLRQFFWAHAFRNMYDQPESIRNVYKPSMECFIECLDQQDIARFSSRLETLMLHELRSGVAYLLQLGVAGANDILIPDEHDD